MSSIKLHSNFEEESKPLFRHLKTKAFRFIIVRYSHYELLRRLENRLKELYPDRAFQKADASEISFNDIQSAYETQKDGFFCLENFDRVLRDEGLSEDKAEQYRQTTSGLNLRRDSFAKRPIALFVFLRADSEPYVRKIMRKMPDLWSFHSLILDLKAERPLKITNNTTNNTIITDAGTHITEPTLPESKRPAKTDELNKLLETLRKTPANEEALRVNLYREIVKLQKDLGYYQKALQTTEAWEKTVRDTAEILFERGDIYCLLSEFKKAKECFELYLNYHVQRKNKYGISAALSQIGNIERLVGNLTKALELSKKGLSISEELFNEFPDNPDYKNSLTASYSNLALVLQGLGGKQNLTEAKALHQKALASYSANFGEQAPTVAISQSNLATVLKDLGGEKNLVAAKELLEKALASDIENFGEQAPTVALRQSNLAMVLEDLGGEKNFVAAKELLEKAMANNIANFGEQAPIVALKQSNLALVLQDLGGEKNLLAAKELLEKAMASDIENFGEQAPTVAVSQSNLATVLQALGGEQNLRAAKELLEKAMANNIANFGEQAPTLAVRQSNLAMVLKALGGEQNLLEAKKLLKQALEICRLHFSEQHYYTQGVTNNLFGLYLLVRTGKEVSELSEKERHDLTPHFLPWVQQEAF